MATYIVKPGESISDVVLNSTGTILNLDLFLTTNGFTDWTPELTPGQIIQVPASAVIDSNTLRQLQSYPSCNNFIDRFLFLIESIFGQLLDRWILKTGYWNDLGYWIDTDYWID